MSRLRQRSPSPPKFNSPTENEPVPSRHDRSRRGGRKPGVRAVLLKLQQVEEETIQVMNHGFEGITSPASQSRALAKGVTERVDKIIQLQNDHDQASLEKYGNIDMRDIEMSKRMLGDLLSQYETSSTSQNSTLGMMDSHFREFLDTNELEMRALLRETDPEKEV
jgi:hypothetical protein